MRNIFALAALAALIAAPAMAYTVVDDFEAYEIGTISGQGNWMAQRNSSAIGDHNFSQVIDMDGNKVLKLTNRDFGEEIDTVYTAWSLGDNDLTGATTTIYLKYQADGPNDTILTTNNLGDLWADADEDGQLDEVGQGTNNYSSLGAMAYLPGNAAGAFRARDGGGYVNDASVTLNTNDWNEMWMHIDNTTGLTTYYVSTDGGTPVKMNNASDDTWLHRNTSNTSVTNIKFMVGGFPWPAMDTETNVIIDTIAISTTDFLLDRAGNVPACIDADFNCDGEVGLLDLDILGTNWGATDATFAMGDANGDGEVGLLDLDALGSNWGNTATPEPATLGLLAIGGLMAIRRR